MSSKVRLIDKDLGWRALFARAEEIKNSRVKVGVLADSKQGGMHVPGGSLTVAEIAAVQEFGTQDGRIPARSFVRSTFDKMREELVVLGKKLITGVMDGKMPLKQALDVMGSTLANGIKRAITDGEGIPPPNAPETIRRKGSSRPLIDTGRLLGAITWSVLVGGKEKGE